MPKNAKVRKSCLFPNDTDMYLKAGTQNQEAELLFRGQGLKRMTLGYTNILHYMHIGERQINRAKLRGR